MIHDNVHTRAVVNGLRAILLSFGFPINACFTRGANRTCAASREKREKTCVAKNGLYSGGELLDPEIVFYGWESKKCGLPC